MPWLKSCALRKLEGTGRSAAGELATGVGHGGTLENRALAWGEQIQAALLGGAVRTAEIGGICEACEARLLHCCVN